MKKILLLSTLSLAVSSATYAQKEDCQLKASVFVEAAKVKNYNEQKASYNKGLSSFEKTSKRREFSTIFTNVYVR